MGAKKAPCAVPGAHMQEGKEGKGFPNNAVDKDYNLIDDRADYQ